jgi:hypothetical protein
MADPLQGIGANQSREFAAMLQRLGRLCADLTKAVTEHDKAAPRRFSERLPGAVSG